MSIAAELVRAEIGKTQDDIYRAEHSDYGWAPAFAKERKQRLAELEAELTRLGG